MTGVLSGIKDKALQNTYFCEVLDTADHTQMVIMSLLPGEEIGEETHKDNDQMLYCVQGSGSVVLNGEEAEFKEGDIVLVHAGTLHNFINSSASSMKIITTYSPSHHPAGTVHKTKEEAEKAEY